MTSVTLPRRVENIHSILKHSNNTDGKESRNRIPDSYPTDKYHHCIKWSLSHQPKKTTRALSCNEEQRPSSSNNPIKHLCSRLIRRFSTTREYRARSEDLHQDSAVHFGDYKSFSSTIDHPVDDFDWPDFEKVYDSIPPCLTRVLPGLIDISNEDSDEPSTDILKFHMDESKEYSAEQINLFEHCKRGKDFRRNAMCLKLDKSQYNGQLDTFIQQLTIEKLMRTLT